MIEVVRSNEDLWIPIEIKQIQQRVSAYNCARSGVPEPINYQQPKTRRWEKRRFVMVEVHIWKVIDYNDHRFTLL